MTAVIESPVLATLASVEQEIRRAVISRRSRYLDINQTAAAWITTLIRNQADRPAEEVLADIAVICTALAVVDLDFFSGEGTG